MVNSKIPAAITIPLIPSDGEEFYAVIIPEESKKKSYNNMWVFRKGCGVALYYTGKLADKDDPTMTVDGIRTLDATGQFDEIKELLCEEN